MNGHGIGQIPVYAARLTAISYPRALRMARVYTAERLPLHRLERGSLRLVGGGKEQDWKGYGQTLLVFSVVFFVLVYVVQRIQGHLFLNPDGLPSVPSHISLN